MIDENSLGYLPLYDPNHSQAYINAMNDHLSNFTMATLLFLDKIEEEVENITKFEKIDFLFDIFQAENKKLSDEIASINQALYFG